MKKGVRNHLNSLRKGYRFFYTETFFKKVYKTSAIRKARMPELIETTSLQTLEEIARESRKIENVVLVNNYLPSIERDITSYNQNLDLAAIAADIETLLIQQRVSMIKKRVLQNNQPLLVADLGCGQGIFVVLMNRKHEKEGIVVFGIDNSVYSCFLPYLALGSSDSFLEEVKDMINHNFNVPRDWFEKLYRKTISQYELTESEIRSDRFIVGDIQGLKHIPDNSFHAIISCYVFVHEDSQERQIKFVEELDRILIPEGIAILHVRNKFEPLYHVQGRRHFGLYQDKEKGCNIVTWGLGDSLKLPEQIP